MPAKQSRVLSSRAAQSVPACGQAISMADWDSHSAGKRGLSLILYSGDVRHHNEKAGFSRLDRDNSLESD
jgi:hypothetical protein